MTSEPIRNGQIPADRDWYYDADPAERREYDAFGPWIGIVQKEEDMPKRFRHAYEELKAARFLYKIPIKADRRSMRPGMDLYRAILAVSLGRVVVLEWDGIGETRYESSLKSIQAVRVSQDLLSATLALLLADGRTVALSYSAVSDKEISAVVSFLREHLTLAPELRPELPQSIPSSPEVEIEDSFYFGLWWKHIRNLPSARILYWEQPGIRLGRLRSSLGSLILTAGNELLIINHGQFVRKWLEAVYSTSEQFVPLSSVQSVRLIPCDKFKKHPYSVLELAVRGHVIKIELSAPFEKQNKLVEEIELMSTNF